MRKSRVFDRCVKRVPPIPPFFSHNKQAMLGAIVLAKSTLIFLENIKVAICLIKHTYFTDFKESGKNNEPLLHRMVAAKCF